MSYGSSSSQPDDASDSGGLEEDELLMGPMDIDEAARSGAPAAPRARARRRRQHWGPHGGCRDPA